MLCPLVSRAWTAAGFHISTGEAIRTTLARLCTSLIVEASGRTQLAREPCENKAKNERATRICHLPIAFRDQMWGASGDVVSFNINSASFMYHTFVIFLRMWMWTLFKAGWPNQLRGCYPEGSCIHLNLSLACTCARSKLRQDLLYLFHHCIVLVYNLASSLPSKLCQARSQNTSQDKTSQKVWGDKELTSKQQIARVATEPFSGQLSHLHHNIISYLCEAISGYYL